MSNLQYNKEYYTKNKIISNKKSKEYTLSNSDKISKNKKEYYKANKESILQKRKKYYETNKEYIKEIKKKYREVNKLKIAKQKKIYQQKVNSTILGKLKHLIRGAIRRSITENGYSKNYKSEHILGCSIEFFRQHLESKFEPWMNWNNKGLYNGELNYGWDLDHKIPLSSATSEDDVIKLNHYTNIQPLCSRINRDIKKHFLE